VMRDAACCEIVILSRQTGRPKTNSHQVLQQRCTWAGFAA
jgi:hypothetical protein